MAIILVVDDSAVDLKVAGNLLGKQAEWSVLFAENGAQAVEMIESDLPDLVVTDLQMPEMNGLELVEVIRNEYPLIPVVLMTAAGSEEIAVEALQRGAASYVPKQQLAADLVSTVSRLLAASAEERSRRRLLNYLSEVTYVLENDLEILSACVAEIRELLRRRYLFDESECLRLASAMDEALSNAYFHGNLEVSSDLREEDADRYHNLADERRRLEPYAERRIHVRVGIDKERVEIQIRDEGPGFDPERLPDPTAPGFLERPCGRGVLLMRAFSDEVHFGAGGNSVTLVKFPSRRSDADTLTEDE